MRAVYLSLAVIGALAPYAFFVPWLLAHGPDLPALCAELFSTRIGAFFGLDVIIAAFASIVFMRRESQRGAVKQVWLPIAATCLVGVSCGLPLFLFLREGAPRN